jgi:hypothetical protein
MILSGRGRPLRAVFMQVVVTNSLYIAVALIGYGIGALLWNLGGITW